VAVSLNFVPHLTQISDKGVVGAAQAKQYEEPDRGRAPQFMQN
jgi:hypothetical protein